MPRAETGVGVPAVRSNNEDTAAASRESNTLRQARGFLSALGVTRSMHSSGVIVAGIFSSLLSVLGFTCSSITYDYLRMYVSTQTRKLPIPVRGSAIPVLVPILELTCSLSYPQLFQSMIEFTSLGSE
jgi:hypothetical protein